MSDFNKLRRAGVKLYPTSPYPALIGFYTLGTPMSEAVAKVLGDLPNDIHGRCSSWTDKGYRLILIGINIEKAQVMSTLAHECYHAVNAIYSWFGCQHDIDNDEPAAYLLGSLVGIGAEEFARMPGVIESISK